MYMVPYDVLMNFDITNRLSPICDVEKQVTKESELGISHLSTVRRALGPGQLPCIMHSVSHINLISVSEIY